MDIIIPKLVNPENFKMKINIPNNLKRSVSAHIPSSYKFINESPAGYGKNSHFIPNKEPIPV